MSSGRLGFWWIEGSGDCFLLTTFLFAILTPNSGKNARKDEKSWRQARNRRTACRVEVACGTSGGY